MFNAVAVKNRIPIPGNLIGIPANIPKCKADINLYDYMTNDYDEECLLEELRFLVSKDLTDYIAELSWAKSEIKHLTHPYMEYTKEKSSVVGKIDCVFDVYFKNTTH